MYSYATASKNKSLKSNRVPPELIQHFKNTAEIPRKSFKENQFPKQTMHYPDTKPNLKTEGQTQKSSQMVKSKIVECDISKIADSYVLEGNTLRKYETYEQVLKKPKKNQSNLNKQNEKKEVLTIDRKSILKLQYLEKMGFLRPDQKEILANYRKLCPQKFQNEPVKIESQPLHTKSYGLPYDEMSNLPYFSPNKNIDGKMLSHFFSPNPKGLYTSKYGY